MDNDLPFKKIEILRINDYFYIRVNSLTSSMEYYRYYWVKLCSFVKTKIFITFYSLENKLYLLFVLYDWYSGLLRYLRYTCEDSIRQKSVPFTCMYRSLMKYIRIKAIKPTIFFERHSEKFKNKLLSDRRGTFLIFTA